METTTETPGFYATVMDGTDDSFPGNGTSLFRPSPSTLSTAAELTEKIQTFGSLLVIPIGLILNSVCSLLFHKLRMHRTATGLHLTAISLSDNLTLFSFAAYNINLQAAGLISNMDVSNYLCKISFSLVKFSVGISNFLLASATCERYISIAFPLKVKSWNLLYVTKVLIGLYFAVSLPLGGLWVYGSIFRMRNTTRVCFIDPRLTSKLWFKLIDTTFYFGLSNAACSAVILIFTILIAYKLFTFRRLRNTMTTTVSGSKQEFRISLMLFIIAFLFVVVKIADLAVNQVLAYHRSAHLTAVSVYRIISLLIIMNHCINFFVYVVFLEDFRRSFVSLFVKESQTRSEPSTRISTVTEA